MILNKQLFKIRTKYSLVILHSFFTHIMDPMAIHGIDILLPTSVIYSLDLITDEHTDKTENKFQIG